MVVCRRIMYGGEGRITVVCRAGSCVVVCRGEGRHVWMDCRGIMCGGLSRDNVWWFVAGQCVVVCRGIMCGGLSRDHVWWFVAGSRCVEGLFDSVKQLKRENDFGPAVSVGGYSVVGPLHPPLYAGGGGSAMLIPLAEGTSFLYKASPGRRVPSC